MSIPYSPSVQDTLELAHTLKFSDSVRQRLAGVLSPAFLHTYADACTALTSFASAQNTWETLRDALADHDSDGMHVLALYLAAACITREKHRAAGISDTVFHDTMGCLPTFVAETLAWTGKEAFDRDYWAWRHLACRLFRLGTLEFEYRTLTESDPLPPSLPAGTPVLSVHIPSNAKLAQMPLHASYLEAKRFFTHEGAVFCDQGAPQAIWCGTWLLSLPLRGLLAPTSGITQFGNDYSIYASDLDSEAFYTWLFDRKKPPETLPQNTSLQRAAAAHLANGGKLGVAYGILKNL